MNVQTIEGQPNASSKRIGIVLTHWHEEVTEQLLQGALKVIEQRSNPADPAEVRVVKVPGSWEIPLAVQKLIDSFHPDAVITLGCILQGETAHARLLASDVAQALMRAQLQAGIPIAWGILTPDTLKQAFDRANPELINRGGEAALAALSLMSTLEQMD